MNKSKSRINIIAIILSIIITSIIVCGWYTKAWGLAVKKPSVNKDSDIIFNTIEAGNTDTINIVNSDTPENIAKVQTNRNFIYVTSTLQYNCINHKINSYEIVLLDNDKEIPEFLGGNTNNRLLLYGNTLNHYITSSDKSHKFFEYAPKAMASNVHIHYSVFETDSKYKTDNLLLGFKVCNRETGKYELKYTIPLENKKYDY